MNLKEKIEAIAERAKWSNKTLFELVVDFVQADGSSRRLIELLNHEAKIKL